MDNFKQHPFYNHFMQICAIPHGSRNEKAISDYIVQFAEQHGLEVYQDKALNVIIKKPGSPGLESAAPVILQCHLDMVCEKAPDSPHDFSNNPILPVEKDGFLMATGTTLGADNGVGVCYILCVLEDRQMQHPPIEAVFTTSEEVGMEGMSNLDISHLESRRMVNLDSEGEGVLFSSCAGGTRYKLELPVAREAPAEDTFPYCLTVQGLRGGHSGIDIGKERANGIILLTRLIHTLHDRFKVQVSHIEGGAKENSIPSIAAATLWLHCKETVDALKEVERFSTVLENEYSITESGMSIKMEAIDAPKTAALDSPSLQSVLSLILLMPNGAFHYSPHLPGEVMASSNLGIARLHDDMLTLTGLIRGNIDSKISETVIRLKYLARISGSSLTTSSGYPAWEFRENSNLRRLCCLVYKEMYGKDMAVASIHGGLECALMAGKCPDMDMAAIGPNLFDAHSIRERVEIASVMRVYEYLAKLLASMR